jgi:hypothetical protein
MIWLLEKKSGRNDRTIKIPRPILYFAAPRKRGARGVWYAPRRPFSIRTFSATPSGSFPKTGLIPAHSLPKFPGKTRLTPSRGGGLPRRVSRPPGEKETDRNGGERRAEARRPAIESSGKVQAVFCPSHWNYEIAQTGPVPPPSRAVPVSSLDLSQITQVHTTVFQRGRTCKPGGLVPEAAGARRFGSQIDSNLTSSERSADTLGHSTKHRRLVTPNTHPIPWRKLVDPSTMQRRSTSPRPSHCATIDGQRVGRGNES